MTMKPKRVYPPKPRSGIHVDILAILASGPAGVRDVAQALGKDELAVQSAFGGMMRHGDIVRLKCKPGEWARYRVRVQV